MGSVYVEGLGLLPSLLDESIPTPLGNRVPQLLRPPTQPAPATMTPGPAGGGIIAFQPKPQATADAAVAASPGNSGSSQGQSGYSGNPGNPPGPQDGGAWWMTALPPDAARGNAPDHWNDGNGQGNAWDHWSAPDDHLDQEDGGRRRGWQFATDSGMPDDGGSVLPGPSTDDPTAWAENLPMAPDSAWGELGYDFSDFATALPAALPTQPSESASSGGWLDTFLKSVPVLTTSYARIQAARQGNTAAALAPLPGTPGGYSGGPVPPAPSYGMSTYPATGGSNKTLWIVGGLAVAGLLLIVMKKKSA